MGTPIEKTALETISYILIPVDLHNGQLHAMAYLFNITYSILLLRPIVQGIGEQRSVRNYTMTRTNKPKLILLYTKHIFRKILPVLGAIFIADLTIVAINHFSLPGQVLLVLISTAITTLGIWTFIAIMLSLLQLSSKKVYLVTIVLIAAAQALVLRVPAFAIVAMVPADLLDHPALWIIAKIAASIILFGTSFIFINNQKTNGEMYP